MLQLKNLTVRIADKEILHSINYDFKPGVVYAIMGPNGSGKSTLAQTVMGSPVYSLDEKSEILFKGEKMNDLTADERAKKGIFLSFQTPMSLAGVTVFQLLRLALTGKKEAVDVRDELVKLAGELKIPDELLSRSLNEDFSGGEKKKMEVLQAAMLDAELMFFDEIDTGTDVDALKIIGEFLHKLASKNRTIVLITHYTRLLQYVAPDVVLVLKDGKLVKEAAGTFANEIEKSGYANV